VLDLGKWGIKAVSGSGKGSLDALSQLKNMDPPKLPAANGASGGTVPGGAANHATKGPLAGDLATSQAADPLIGTTLPGARAPVTVTAESTIGGKTIVDTNQTARPVTAADANKPTLIADLIPPGAPNSTMANAHAEVGLIQQAYDAGLTRGQPMTIVVRGEAVCTFCQSNNNLIAAADRAGLSSLTVVDTVAGKTYTWTRGNSGWSTPK
jgi:filamentous hemagglutinin